MAYRVWAAGRACDMATWVSLRGNGNPNHSAAERAWELAVELKAAEATGETIANVALGRSKT
eukprot:9194947-Lingulodinium_polyedra.AAC.1